MASTAKSDPEKNSTYAKTLTGLSLGPEDGSTNSTRGNDGTRSMAVEKVNDLKLTLKICSLMLKISKILSAMLGSTRSIDNDESLVCKNSAFLDEARTVELLRMYRNSRCPFAEGMGRLLTTQLTVIDP
jgi:hypothetical protein